MSVYLDAISDIQEFLARYEVNAVDRFSPREREIIADIRWYLADLYKHYYREMDQYLDSTENYGGTE
jgi:hypothetical protein